LLSSCDAPHNSTRGGCRTRGVCARYISSSTISNPAGGSATTISSSIAAKSSTYIHSARDARHVTGAPLVATRTRWPRAISASACASAIRTRPEIGVSSSR